MFCRYAAKEAKIEIGEINEYHEDLVPKLERINEQIVSDEEIEENDIKRARALLNELDELATIYEPYLSYNYLAWVSESKEKIDQMKTAL